MSASPKIADLAALRSLISQRAPGLPAATPCPLGLPALDAALGGGLPRGCLQEVIPADGGAAAAGFAAFLLGRLVGQAEERGRGVLWASLGEGDLYPPGLARFRPRSRGHDPALRPQPGGAALGHGGGAALPGFGRGGGRGRPARPHRRPAPAAGCRGRRRGRVPAAPRRPASPPRSAPPRCAGGSGRGPIERWHVELLRRRGGRPGAWILEREDETDRLLVAAELGDGSAAPQARFSPG